MRHRKQIFSALLLAAIVFLFGLALFSHPNRAVLAGPLEFTSPADVQAPAASYAIPWESFASGGALTSSSASYTLQSTIGQAVAGSTTSASYDLCSGFWCGIKEWVWDIFLPIALRD